MQNKSLFNRNEAVAAYQQVTTATRALTSTLKQDSPDPLEIAACIEQGAIVENIGWDGWPRTLIKLDMIPSMRLLVENTTRLSSDESLNMMDHIAKHGSVEMLHLLIPKIKPDARELYNAFNRAVSLDRIEVAGGLISYGAPFTHDRYAPIASTITSPEMFDFLSSQGVEFTKRDLINAAIIPEQTFDDVPRFKIHLLRHMLEKGVPIEGGDAANPVSCLLRNEEHSQKFKPETIEALQLLQKHGAKLDGSLKHIREIPKMLLLMEAGLPAQAIMDHFESCDHIEWLSWKDYPRSMFKEDNQLLAARRMLMEFSDAGISLEEMDRLTYSRSTWKEALYLAGCRMPNYEPQKSTSEHQSLREEAILRRQTPSANKKNVKSRL